VPYRQICGFGDDFSSDSVLFLIILSMKERMYIEVRPHVGGNSRCENVNCSAMGSRLRLRVFQFLLY
jgi:hypothetical protein